MYLAQNIFSEARELTLSLVWLVYHSVERTLTLLFLPVHLLPSLQVIVEANCPESIEVPSVTVSCGGTFEEFCDSIVGEVLARGYEGANEDENFELYVREVSLDFLFRTRAPFQRVRPPHFSSSERNVSRGMR